MFSLNKLIAMTENTNTIDWNDFSKIEMRVGTILSAEVFKEAKKPAYKITIDFGEYGIKKSSAQVTDLYQPDDIVGKQVVAVINFPPKQIATIKSECLILGSIGTANEVTLLTTERPVENGLRIG